MNILKAIGALSSSAPPAAESEGAEKTQGQQAARQSKTPQSGEGAGANLMAQAIMRHEGISNRVHSGKPGRTDR